MSYIYIITFLAHVAGQNIEFLQNMNSKALHLLVYQVLKGIQVCICVCVCVSLQSTNTFVGYVSPLR